MTEIVLDAAAGVTPFATVRRLLALTGFIPADDAQRRALALLDPWSRAARDARERGSLTERAVGDDQIRFFLLDRLDRAFANLWLGLAAAHPDGLDVTVLESDRLDPGAARCFAVTRRLRVPVRVTLAGAGDSSAAPTPYDGVDDAEAEARLSRLFDPATARDAPEELRRAAADALAVGDAWSARTLAWRASRGGQDAAMARLLGIASTILDQTVEAEGHYRRWHRYGDAIARAASGYNLAMLYARHHPAPLRSIDRAAELLDTAYAELDHVDPEVARFSRVFNRNGYALVLFRRGRVDEAIATLEDGIERLDRSGRREDLHRSVLIYNLGQCHARRGAHEAAVATFRRLVEVDGAMPENRIELAHALIAVGRPEAAVEHLRAATAQDPAIGAAWSALGYVLLQLGDAAGATEAYANAWRVDRRRGKAVYDLAYAQAEAGRGAAACDTLREGRRWTAADDAVRADAAALAAEQLHALGRAGDAVGSLRALAAEHPGDDALREHLAVAERVVEAPLPR